MQFPSPCTEIALARLATQKPEYPKKDSRRSELIAIAENRRMNHGSSGTVRFRNERRLSDVIVWKRNRTPKQPTDSSLQETRPAPPPRLLGDACGAGVPCTAGPVAASGRSVAAVENNAPSSGGTDCTGRAAAAGELHSRQRSRPLVSLCPWGSGMRAFGRLVFRH